MAWCGKGEGGQQRRGEGSLGEAWRGLKRPGADCMGMAAPERKVVAAKHNIGKARKGEERLGNQWQGSVFTKHMEPNNGNF